MMRPHYSQPSREDATPSSGTSPLASYKEIPPSPPPGLIERGMLHEARFFWFMAYTENEECYI